MIIIVWNHLLVRIIVELAAWIYLIKLYVGSFILFL